MANRRWGREWKQWQILFSRWFVHKITVDSDCSHEIEGHFFLVRKAMTNLDSVLKSRNILLPTKICIVKAMVFPVVTWMWELVYKEGWALKNLCFQIVMLEKTLKSPLDCKEIKPVNAKGNQPWIFTRRAYSEAEAPILWSSDARIWLVGKNPGAEKDRKVFINFPSIIHL